MTQLDVEEKRLSRQRWVETPTTRRRSDATEPVLMVIPKACKRSSGHSSTLIDPVDPGGSTVSSRSGALGTGPHLGWQGDETGSRAFDISIYYLIPSYNDRHGLQRQREAGRLALGRRVAAEEARGPSITTGGNRAGKGLKGVTDAVWLSHTRESHLVTPQGTIIVYTH